MRIGLLVDDPRLPCWQQQAAALLAQAGVDVIAIVRSAAEHTPSRHEVSTEWPDPLAATLFRLWERFDRWIAGSGRSSKSVPASMDVRFVSQDDASDELAALDLLIDLDTEGGALPADMLRSDLPQWTLRLSRYPLAAGAPRGFWEASRGDKTIEISVSDAYDGRVLRRRVIGSMRRSWTMQRRMIESLAGPMLVDAITDYRRGNGAPDAGTFLSSVDQWPGLGRPGTGAILAVAARTLVAIGSRLFVRVRRLWPQWFVLLGHRRGGRWRLREFERLEPPSGRIWADPFPCLVNGADGQVDLVLFAEEMAHDVGRGTIVVLQRGSDGWAPTPVIEESHHLSYPYLFEWQGERYMVPESSDANEISLYRMSGSITEWHREPALMQEVRAVDSSLLVHEGRIWLFTNILREPDFAAHYYELHLFFADMFPTTDWTPHPANPVVCDARHARMGGGFLRHEGDLFRVAQGSCCGEYGTSIELRRISRLDVDEYAEEEAGSLTPDWASELEGMHHLAVLGDLLLVDARRNVAVR